MSNERIRINRHPFVGIDPTHFYEGIIVNFIFMSRLSLFFCSGFLLLQPAIGSQLLISGTQRSVVVVVVVVICRRLPTP